MASLLLMKTMMKMMKVAAMALARTEITCVTIAAINGGGTSIHAGGGAGGGVVGRALFCGLIGADGKRCRQPGAIRPPNASETSSASSMAWTSTWTSTWTLSRRCDLPPSLGPSSGRSWHYARWWGSSRPHTRGSDGSHTANCMSCYSRRLHGGELTASEKILPCASRMDDGCVADLGHRGCDPAAAVAILPALGWAAANATAKLASSGEEGGDTTKGGGGGGIKGWIIVIVVVDVKGVAVELKAMGSMTAVGGARWQ